MGINYWDTSKMKLIQPALFLLALFCLITYFRFFRSVLLDRIISCLAFLIVALAILLPDLTSYIANFVGVGRGTDLAFYLFALGCLFIFVLLYSKIIKTEMKLTELVRALAIKELNDQEKLKKQ